MSAVKRFRSASHLVLVEGVRGFRLVITPGRGETFGVTLQESYGENGGAITADLTGERLTPFELTRACYGEAA